MFIYIYIYTYTYISIADLVSGEHLSLGETATKLHFALRTLVYTGIKGESVGSDHTKTYSTVSTRFAVRNSTL